jgi:CrcB protein
MKTLIQWIAPCMAIGAGGFFGALARFFVAGVAGRWFRTSFPVGTFVINITGSLFLGWFLAVMRNRVGFVSLMNNRLTISWDTILLGVGTGFVGAYTTFSTFMSESNTLLEQGSAIQAVVNLVGSLVIGLLAVRVGIWIGGT